MSINTSADGWMDGWMNAYTIKYRLKFVVVCTDTPPDDVWVIILQQKSV